ncbi:MAG: ester cyclase [Paracoccaceae bacterium]
MTDAPKASPTQGARPEQAVLTRDADPSKTDETRRVIEGMVDGLNDHKIDGMETFFHESFRWMGNTGCGTKNGLAEFQRNWMRPFQAAFSDKVCIDEARLYMGEWAAAFGRQEATHSGTFLGIPPTGKRVEIRYMDFWRVEDGRIADNWVSVDLAGVAAQLGRDLFDGEGWERFDRGDPPPPIGWGRNRDTDTDTGESE